MHFLVTGATGFIGGPLVQRLLDDGCRVTALVRDRDAHAAQRLRAHGATIHVADITSDNGQGLRFAMRGVDGVFHLAAARVGAASDRGDLARVNVEGTRKVFEALRAIGIPRAVYTSALAVNGDTRGQLVDEHFRYDGPLPGDYERSKRRADREVVEPLCVAGAPVIVLMPGLVYGPGDRSAVRDTFRQYLRGELPLVPRNTAYCWSFVDDVVDVHVRAMLHGRVGERYIVAGPMHTFVDAFEIASRITGIPAPQAHVSPAVLRLAAAMLGVLDEPTPPRWARTARRPAAGTSQLGNDAKARRELGFDPRDLDAGLRVTLRHEMREMGMHTAE